MLSQAGTTPLTHPRQPRPRPSEDVFGCIGPKYVLGGPGGEAVEGGEGCLYLPGSPRLVLAGALENACFWGKTSLSRENAPKCSKKGGT